MKILALLGLLYLSGAAVAAPDHFFRIEKHTPAQIDEAFKARLPKSGTSSVFRVERKNVSNGTITIDVRLTLPLVDFWAKDLQQIRFELKELKSAPGFHNYTYTAKSGTDHVSGDMKVEPWHAASLIEVKIAHSTLPNWQAELLYQSFYSLGFIQSVRPK